MNTSSETYAQGKHPHRLRCRSGGPVQDSGIVSGHLRKRGADSWQLIVCNGFDSNGRRQYGRKTFHGTKKQAERELAAFVSKRARARRTLSPRVGHSFRPRRVARAPVGPARTRNSRPVPRRDQTRASGAREHAGCALEDASHRGLLRPVAARGSFGRVDTQDPLGHAAVAGMGQAPRVRHAARD